MRTHHYCINVWYYKNYNFHQRAHSASFLISSSSSCTFFFVIPVAVKETIHHHIHGHPICGSITTYNWITKLLPWQKGTTKRSILSATKRSMYRSQVHLHIKANGMEANNWPQLGCVITKNVLYSHNDITFQTNSWYNQGSAMYEMCEQYFQHIIYLTVDNVSMSIHWITPSLWTLVLMSHSQY